MPRLTTRKRASLPKSAFAYIDARGRRRLPIHDRAHVKNALARFNQVAFENEAARDRARTRLLNRCEEAWHRSRRRHGRPDPAGADARGRPTTALVHDRAVLDDSDLVETVRAAVRFVVERDRAYG